jgi:hypothetical protein
MAFSQSIINNIADYLCAHRMRTNATDRLVTCRFKQISPRFYLAVVLTMSRPSPFVMCKHHHEAHVGPSCLSCATEINKIKVEHAVLLDELADALRQKIIYTASDLIMNPSESIDRKYYAVPSPEGHAFLENFNARRATLRTLTTRHRMQLHEPLGLINRMGMLLVGVALEIVNRSYNGSATGAYMTLPRSQGCNLKLMQPTPLFESMICRMFDIDELVPGAQEKIDESQSST